MQSFRTVLPKNPMKEPKADVNARSNAPLASNALRKSPEFAFWA
jgi:hypothetical protein